jgi:hypothetical protein
MVLSSPRAFFAKLLLFSLGFTSMAEYYKIWIYIHI